MPTRKNNNSLWFLFGASVLSVALSYVPLAWVIVYPIRLFVTFVHEGGHALAAILTLGDVDSLHVYLDASGTTLTRGGLGIAIASAGYLTSTVFGAALLIVCSQAKFAKAALTVCAGLVLVTAFLAGDTVTLFMGMVLVLLLVGAAIMAGQDFAHFLISFLAVQCCLNAFLDLRTLFLISTTTTAHSDAANMAQMTPFPAVFWAVFWLGLSAIALLYAVRRYLQNL